MQVNSSNINNDTSEDREITNVTIKKLAWPVKLFFFSILVPTSTSFYFGSFRITAYRLVLLIFFLPCVFRIFFGKNEKTILTDWFICFYSIWIVLALIVNHGLIVGLESGGILLIESLSAYLLARTYIKDSIDFGNFVSLAVILTIGLTFITFPEAITGKNILRPNGEHIGARLGLIRAYGPFDHPILYGVFCASIVSLALYVPSNGRASERLYKLKAGWMAVAAFLSLSSGALVAVIIQLGLAIWKTITKESQSRWYLFSFIILFCYLAIDFLSNRTPLRVFLQYLTFSSSTAFNRLIIWEWGTKYNVAEHPLFGIGLGEWTRPSWMTSTSMDNFWLVNMVRYGLPCFIFLAAGILRLLIISNKKIASPHPAAAMVTGWSFSIVGVIIAGTTVHFWNSLYVWFFFLLGSGAWLSQIIDEQHSKTLQ